ncbi:hypothetical protein DMH25_08255 [Streptomyces sp. WAC 01325]|uniref:hypothetical protein n=1 Tax=Streptomyces sp. WAC 01325 TaxID=2203202 RepID=UPI000F85FBA5|nr:hypothetical protein [Streptomyces sp. WAC 01325]RSN13770.1 hypothetical protein DMH25_08255 [Streptomyces sp. WAC 01325]
MITTYPTDGRLDGPIHTWFSLSYCNYAVLPRTLLQSMPVEFQERMVACLTELQAAFEHVPQAEVYDVKAATEHIVNEMSDVELKQAGIVADWYRGETPPDGLSEQDLAEWREQNEDPEGPAYSRDGEELDGHERVLLPADDPVPHYNRGRRYIEPRPADSLPGGFERHACVTVKCAACSYPYDETEFTHHYQSMGDALDGAVGAGWDELRDGRVLCETGDEKHEELRRTVGVVDDSDA